MSEYSTYQTRLENLQKDANVLLQLLDEYKNAYALETDPRIVFNYRNEIAKLNEQLFRYKTEIEDLEIKIQTEKTSKSIEAVEEDVKVVIGQLTESTLASSLEKKVESLSDQYTQMIQQLQGNPLPNAFEPRLSVLRPNVKLVDANLAYKYADLQGDLNILFGFTTLFLGTAISSGTSLGIEMLSAVQSNSIPIYWSVFVMSILVSAIFGYLTYRTYKKANSARAKLEADAEVNDIDLSFVKNNKLQTSQEK